jgi:hypothetical protein
LFDHPQRGGYNKAVRVKYNRIRLTLNQFCFALSALVTAVSELRNTENERLNTHLLKPQNGFSFVLWSSSVFYFFAGTVAAPLLYN